MRLLECMESFVQLAQVRHFSRAAKLSGISTSSLSRRIQSLETELGCVLVQRSTRGVALTGEGQQVLARARRLLQDAAGLKHELAQSSNVVSGHLRVGAHLDLAIAVLGPTLAEFCREHDAITVDFAATQGSPDLLRDRLDVAFVIVHQRPLPDSFSTLHRVGSIPRLLFASEEYLRSRGEPASAKGLSDHTCVRHLYERPESAWDLRSGTKRVRVPVHGAFATTSLTNAAQAAREGLGIALLPSHLARSTPDSSASLKRILSDWEGLPALIFAVTAQDSRSAKISALLQWTRARVPARLERLDVVPPAY